MNVQASLSQSIFNNLTSSIKLLDQDQNASTFLLALLQAIKQLTSKFQDSESRTESISELYRAVSSMSNWGMANVCSAESSHSILQRPKTYIIAAQLMAKVYLISLLVNSPFDWLAHHQRSPVLEIAKMLQRLRFQVQVQNIGNMDDRKVVEFQNWIASILRLAAQFCEGNSILGILQEAMEQENSNVQEQSLRKMVSIMAEVIQRKKQKMESTAQGKKDVGNYALRYIALKQKQLKQKSKLKKQEQNGEAEKERLKNCNKLHYNKSRQIIKTRTIYQSRKNIYVPRRKLQQLQKCDSLDHSTQWSSTNLKIQRSSRDVNQDFEDDILVTKTPKQTRINFYKPIEIKLDFF